MGSDLLVAVRGIVRPACLACLVGSGAKEVVKGGCEVSASILDSNYPKEPEETTFRVCSRQQERVVLGKCLAVKQSAISRRKSAATGHVFTMPLLFTGDLPRA